MPLGVKHQNNVCHRSEESAQLRLGCFMRLFRTPTRSTVLSLLHLTLDGRDKPRQIIFHQVIARPGSHSLDSDRFTYGA